MSEEEKENYPQGKGIISFIIGILALIFVLIPILGLLLSILAILFSRYQSREGYSFLGNLGLVMGIMGIIINIIVMLVLIGAFFYYQQEIGGKQIITEKMMENESNDFESLLIEDVREEGNIYINTTNKTIVEEIEEISLNTIEINCDQEELENKNQWKLNCEFPVNIEEGDNVDIHIISQNKMYSFNKRVN